MTYVPKRGDTFLIDCGVRGKHLCVLLNDDANGESLLASVSSIKAGSKSNDLTCVVRPGEHPRIHLVSFVYYRDVLRYKTAHFQRCVDAGLFDLKEPVAVTLLSRIRAGVLASPMTPRGTKALFRTLPP